ncbi:MAG: hypothetical protein N3E51_04705 [Candidatus Micrarchaeota archaeon]|nr:hypothetical protein [Candidatus Micrarchaeota archaeon]
MSEHPDCRQRYVAYVERKSEEVNGELAVCREKKALLEQQIASLEGQLEMLQNSLALAQYEMSVRARRR